MKILSLLAFTILLSASAHADDTSSVVGQSTQVQNENPYQELSPSVVPALTLQAEQCALFDAMKLCGSETVRRTADYTVTQNIQRPECQQYYDGCTFDSDIIVTVTASAPFDCLAGPAPISN